MARRRVDSPESHDGLIDRHPQLMPLGRFKQQPKLEIVIERPAQPAQARPTLAEDDDREQICDAVLAERRAARERSKSWLDIACARRAGYARQEMAYAQQAAAKIISTLYRTHPEVMAEWGHDRRLFEQLDAKGWDFDILVRLHLDRFPEHGRMLTEHECRRALA